MTGVHRKARPGAPAGFFRCEAAGLRWLRVPGGVPVVEVLDVGDDHLDLVRLDEVAPTPWAAAELGARLAVTHDAGAEAFGAPPAGWAGHGWFGPLSDPLPMAAASETSWGRFLADHRLAPVLTRLRDDLDADDLQAAEVLLDRLRAGTWDDEDPPARVHGDLWQGNVLWTESGATLIDPAAHGGHRETDLAMLALFGLPHLDVVLDAYTATHPLPAGWQDRVGLHQLYPVAVHAALFGGGYLGRTRDLLHTWAGA